MLLNLVMKTIEEIRRQNLAEIAKELGSIQAVADAIGKSHSQVSQWKNGSIDKKSQRPRTMDSESARLIELKCGKDVGWMDNIHAATETKRPNTMIEKEVPQSYGMLLDSIFDPNAFKKQLDYFYQGMSQDHKEAIVMMANRLHNIDHPESGIANPAGVVNKNKTQKVMGTARSGDENARARNTHQRVSK
jgi:hypothetical protein